jgi:hypothetical protein
MLKVLVSSAASDRLSTAAQFLSGFPHSAETLVIGGTRAAADDFARHYARLQDATFGIHRFSLLQLAARISALRLAADGRVPCSALGMEATVVRAVHAAHSDGSLQYFSPVALLPGFAKAVRATASELRAAGIAAVNLEHLPPPGPDVSSFLAAIEGQLTAAHLVDLAAAAGHIARTVCWKKPKDAVILTPTGPEKSPFVHDVVARLTSKPIKPKGITKDVGPFRIIWESKFGEEKAAVLKKLAGRRRTWASRKSARFARKTEGRWATYYSGPRESCGLRGKVNFLKATSRLPLIGSSSPGVHFCRPPIPAASAQ